MEKLLTEPNPLKRWIPSRLKRAARGALLSHAFRRAVQQIAGLPHGEVPSREVLGRLRTGWDNSGWDGKLDYLEEVAARAAATPGPVLECGSGLTTVLVGLLAGRRGVETWSLEHHPQWHARVVAALGKHRVPNVEVCLAPLRDYEGFNWYDPPLGRMPDQFSLVVCDGPPDIEGGGRYGLLPVMEPRLAPEALILFDDAREAGQEEVLRRWETEGRANVELRETVEVSFALVRLK
jgi:hypothetical protein